MDIKIHLKAPEGKYFELLNITQVEHQSILDNLGNPTGALTVGKDKRLAIAWSNIAYVEITKQ